MSKYPPNLLQRFSDVLRYDPLTGYLWWLQKISIRCRIDRPAGHDVLSGYIAVGIDGKKYLAHRVAWAMHYGSHPAGHIDHINGDKKDNRISNLRDVSRNVNLQNIRSARTDNTSGILGAEKSRRKWCARINCNGERKYLGAFNTPEEAGAAYLEAKRRLHPGCTI